MKVLITGSSWFIWFNTSKKLLERGDQIIGFDNENDFYDVSLKESRRKILESYSNFKFYKWSLENHNELKNVFISELPDKVLNLAAQSWVRYSQSNPNESIQSNIVWFTNLIDLSKEFWIKNFVYASSSSIYGHTDKDTCAVTDRTDTPVSIYAATKKTNELMAYTYSHSFWLNTIGLRFFTVYWPYSRPDLVTHTFVDKINKWITIDLFNFWKVQRDFTYIDDIVNWIILSLDSNLKCELFNLWNKNPVDLEYLVDLIELNLWKKAIKNYLPAQSGDIHSTNADISYTTELLWWKPSVNIEKWIENLVEWYRDYYK